MHRIAVVTSGRDAPGMNAAVRAVVRTGVTRGLEVFGIERGYQGLLDGQFTPLSLRAVGGIINRGGSFLRTVHSEEFKTEMGILKACEILKDKGVEGLVVIGGDGAFRAAVDLHKVSGVPMVGVPASIDNDIAGTDETFGFDTAVNTAVADIDKIRDTATSHERVFIIEVMGADRGFIALDVGLACGAEVILVPEIKFDVETVCETLRKAQKRGRRSGIIVKAEGAGEINKLKEEIQKRTGFQVRATILGHVQRGGSPTAHSRKLAALFGSASVALLLRGAECDMVGIQNGRVISVALDPALRGVKKLDEELYRLAMMLSR